MLSEQELVQLIARATSEDVESGYKSMQELIRIIASCIGIDDDGEAYLKIKIAGE